VAVRSHDSAGQRVFLFFRRVEFGAGLCSAMLVGECTRAVIHMTPFDCVLALAAPRLRNPYGRNHQEQSKCCFA
jgi:hypothetical protein